MRKKNTRKHTGKRLRMKKITAFLLVSALSLSAWGCGKEAEPQTGKKTGSIFDLFADNEDPFDGAIVGTTEGRGDQIVDPPVIDLTTDSSSTETTEATEISTESTTETTEAATEDPTYATVESQEFNDLMMKFFKESVTESKITCRSYLLHPEDYGIEMPTEVTWGEPGASKETIDDVKKELEESITELEQIDVSTLTEQQRFDYDYMMDNLVTSRVTAENYQLESAFSVMRGLETNIPSFFTDYEFREKQDVEDYLQMILLLPDYIDQCLAVEQEKIDDGYGPEDCVLDEMISRCDENLNQTGDDHFMIANFNDTIDGLDFLTDAEKQEYKEKNRQAVLEAFDPAYEKMKSTFQSWKGKGKVKGGLCNYGQGGKDLYAYLVREYTGSSKSLPEMIDYVEKKIDTLKSNMTSIYLSNPEAYMYYSANTDDLFDYLKDRDTAEIVDYFFENTMEEYPKIDPIQYKVLYFSKSIQEIRKNILAYYSPPQIDDPDGNLIRVNGRNTDGLWVTLAHEGCPGHMYQEMYYRSTNPCLVRHLGLELGYAEGWAVYTSYRTLQYCDFNGSEYAKQLAELVQLEEEIGYLIHGRVDLGINYEGWTVDDVASYLAGKGMDSSAAQRLYSIMVADPGVYLSYSMGYYEMLDLRTYAEQELGSRFDPVEFHKVILETGPCKYDQLKKRVDKYISEH